jgi:hypothetical protein
MPIPISAQAIALSQAWAASFFQYRDSDPDKPENDQANGAHD